MAESMVERVARALFVAQQSGMPEWVQRRRFDDLDEASGVKVRYMTFARAAIEAMRDPTEAMVLAGEEFCGGVGIDPEIEKIWPAMIDAALKEGE